MEFRISDTFTDSLAKLTGQEQKAVKTTAFDLQLDPANPGMRLHRIDKSRDRNFWSIRVNSDIRLIVHKTDASLLLCYVDHHDKAYRWAERRRIERHPRPARHSLGAHNNKILFFTRFKIRNSKHETRNKSKTPSSNVPNGLVRRVF